MFLEYSSTDEAQSQWFSVLSGGDPSGLWIEPVVSLDSGIRRNDGRDVFESLLYPRRWLTTHGSLVIFAGREKILYQRI
jgi:hypothetical protein